MLPGQVQPSGSLTFVFVRYAERSPDVNAAVGMLTRVACVRGSCNSSKSMKKNVLSFP